MIYDRRHRGVARIPTRSAVTAYARGRLDDGLPAAAGDGGLARSDRTVDGEPAGTVDAPRRPGREPDPCATRTPYGGTGPVPAGRRRRAGRGARRSRCRTRGIPRPEVSLVDRRVRAHALLAFIEDADDADRWKDVLPVAGWLDEDTVVYESRGATHRLVAWRVGTHELPGGSRR